MVEPLIIISWMVLGIVYCNGLEWVTHKYILHGRGKRRKRFRKFHMVHHRLARTNNFADPEYVKFGFRIKEKEPLAIMLLAVLHIPVIWISPVLFLSILFGGLSYLFVHYYSHKDINWAKKYVPWHWDHHMGPARAVEANWCVTFPLFDIIMGTRVKYYGTKQYYLDIAKQSSKKLRKIKNGQVI